MSNSFLKLSTALGLKIGPVRQGVTPKRTLEYVLQGMIRIRDDHGLTTDPEAVSHYKGALEAYRDVAHYIAPLTDLVKNGNGNSTPPV